MTHKRSERPVDQEKGKRLKNDVFGDDKKWSTLLRSCQRMHRLRQSSSRPVNGTGRYALDCAR